MTDAAATLTLAVDTKFASEQIGNLATQLTIAESSLGSLQKMLNQLDGFASLTREVSQFKTENTSLKTQVEQLNAELGKVSKSASEMGRSAGQSFKNLEQNLQQADSEVKKFAGSFSVALADGTKVAFKSVNGDLVKLVESVSSTGTEMVSIFRNAGISIAADAKEQLQQKVALQNQEVALWEMRQKERNEITAISQARDVELYQMASEKRLAMQAQDTALWEMRQKERNEITAISQARDVELHQMALAKKLEMDRAAAAAEVLIWKDVAFNTASATSRLRTGTMAAEAKTLGLSDAAIVEKYGQAALNASKNVAALVTAVEAEALAARNASAALTRATTSTLEFAAANRDAHDVARGLSGALGGLWMTYGQMVPLIAGFAIASSLKEAVSAGKDFEYQMAFVKSVTEETTEAIESASKALINLAQNSMFAPLEQAQGLRILAQAGITLADSMAILPGMMALATMGETNLAEAAETATGIMYAFNLQIADMGKIGDVIAKAAAISITSVKGMSESMKQASSVAQQYDIDLTTTAASLVVLAERNIKGQAAGTAFRNMMNELSNPTEKAQRAFKALGLSMYESDGRAKSVTKVMNELRVSLKDYDRQSQNLLTSSIFGERGNKAAQAILARTAEGWRDLMKEIDDSSGFLTRSMIELSDTVEGKFLNLGAVYHATMKSAYEATKPYILEFVESLKSALNSSEMKDALVGISTTIVKVMKLLVEYFNLVKLVAQGWLLFHAGRIAMAAVIPVITGITSAFTFLRAATLASLAAQAGLSTAYAAGAGLMTSYGVAGGIAAGGVLSLSAALTATRNAAIAMNTALLANPIGWVTVVVGGLTAAIILLTQAKKDLNAQTKKAIDQSDQVGSIFRREGDVVIENIRLLEEELGYRKAISQEKLDSAKSALAASDKQLKAATDAKSGWQEGQRLVSRGVSIDSNIKEVAAYKNLLVQKRANELAHGELTVLQAANRRKDALQIEADNARKAKKPASGTKTITPEDLKAFGKQSKSDPVKTLIDSMVKYNEVTKEAMENQGYLTASEKKLAGFEADRAKLIGSATTAQKARMVAELELVAASAKLERKNYDMAAATKAYTEQSDLKIKSIDSEADKYRALVAAQASAGEIGEYTSQALTEASLRQQVTDTIEQQVGALDVLGKEIVALGTTDEARTAELVKEMTTRMQSTEALQNNTEAVIANNKAKLAKDGQKYLEKMDKELVKLNATTASAMRKLKVDVTAVELSERDALALDLRTEAEERYASALDVHAEKLKSLREERERLEDVILNSQEGSEQFKAAYVQLDELDKLLPQVADRYRNLGTAAKKAGEDVASMSDALLNAKYLKRDIGEMIGVFETGFKDMLSGGEDAWKKFTKNLRDTFKKQVIDQIYRQFLQEPIRVMVTATLTGLSSLMSGTAAASGTAGTVSAAGSAAQGFSSVTSIASTAASIFAPGAASFAVGEGIAGLASALGASTGVATGIGAFASAAVPWIGAIVLVASLFKKKPSDKAAWGSIDLSSGEIGDRGNMTGKKFSQENIDATSSALTATAGWAKMLKDLGGTVSGSVKLIIGSRDGLRADMDGDGSWEIAETNSEVFFDKMFKAMVKSATGLDNVLKDILVSFDGTAEELSKFASALLQVREYTTGDVMQTALDQIEDAGRSAWAVWSDGNSELTVLANSFNGTLSSAQQLGAMTQAQYQMELNLIGQIQGMLVASSSMFESSIRDIQMSVMDDPQKYDFLRTEVDSLYAQLTTAFDPTVISTLSQQINELTKQAYGMLDDDQKKGAAGEYVTYLEEVGTLTEERLNAAQAQIVDQHKAMAKVIEDAMQVVADQMLESALINREAAAVQLAAANQEQTIRLELLNSGLEVGQG